ncbi:MAG: 2-hydroxyacid dehydrogenase [Gemmatimonadales bacterium]
MTTIMVTRTLPRAVEEEIVAAFPQARLNPADRPLDAAGLGAALREADGILCTVSDRFTEDVLAVHPRRARILANFGVGYNNIDVAAAKAAGLVVTNTPGVLTETTADLAMALILAVARRIGEGERELRAGRWTGWRPTHMMGAEVHGRTLGIVGLGRIGRAVARRAHHGFGIRVLAATRSPLSPGEAAGAGVSGFVTLDELLPAVDFLSLHCPATPDTRHLIDARRLGRMKESAFLINTARGDVVDEHALIEALRTGTIAGAGLDVYEREPDVPVELLRMDNVVLLPHLGSATTVAREAMGRRALANLRAFFEGHDPPDRVA